jgi:predicted glutamine amidotransferase
MCRLLGWVARDGLNLREVLGEESFVAFAQLAHIHADGWGLASTDGEGIALERSTSNASSDPAFATIATEVVARGAIAHLRWASPGLPVELRNAHPFRYDGTAMAHNGGIYPFDRIDELVPDDWRSRLTGTTDSERYFLAVLTLIAAGATPHEALRDTADEIARTSAFTSLNCLLITPDELIAMCRYDPDGPLEDKDPEYYRLRYRVTDDAVVVSSSGWGFGWQELANGDLLVVGRGTLASRIESGSRLLGVG